MFKRTRISAASALVLTGMATFSMAVQAQQSLERVEITGSSIKRIQVEGATPVQVINKEEIKKTGATSVGELMNSLPAMAGADDGSFSLDSTRSGFQGAAMPGFENNDTLVLLNGRRLSKYPEGGEDVDLNSIPISVIERIEVLRDGASAIYGSDAIAGVINIITKTDYEGFGALARYGRSSRGDGAKKQGSISFGRGNLDRDGYNVFGAFEFANQKRIKNADRDITKSADLRQYGLGDDRLPTSPEPNVYLVDDDLYQPIRPCAAPLPPDGVAVESALPGKVCAFDPNAITLLQPDIVSRGLMAGLSVKLGEGLVWRTEYFDRFKKSGNFLNPQPIANEVAAADPTNPYGQDVFWFFRSTDPRLYRQKDIEVKSRRILTEVTGTAGEYDWSVDLGGAQSSYQETGGGYFVNSLFTQAIADGTINPFVSTPQADDLVKLTATPVRRARTSTSFSTAKVSGPYAQLEAGPALFAAGLGFTNEKYINTPDPLQAQGLLRGDPQLAFVDAKRLNAGFFAETVLPLSKFVEATVAMRHDVYSDFGETTNPKVSFKLQPAPELLFRASAGTGYRAPGLEELYGTNISGFPQGIDREGCRIANTSPCRPRQIFTVTVSNPNLRPEKSTAFTLGGVFEPTKALSIAIDYIEIEKKGAIEGLSLQTILDNPDVPVAGYGTARDLVRRLGNGQIDPSTTTPAVTAPTANLAGIQTQSLDLSIRSGFKLGPVALKLDNATTFLISRKKSPIPGLPYEEYRGLAGYPEWRNVLALSGDTGRFTTVFYVRTIDGFKDVDEPSAVDADTRKVPSWTTVDLTLGYRDLFAKGTSISFGVKNLFDKLPPLSNALNTSNKIDFNHSAVGRYYMLTAGVEF